MLRTIRFSFNTSSKTEVTIERRPQKWVTKRPVYLPPRELLTIAPGFVSLYETTHLEFEETYRDTCLLLGAPLAKGPREVRIRALLAPIEEAMDGKVESDSTGRFYLRTSIGRIEMHLVAEGLRKLAMLARLVATGQLVDKGFLFWDEPEANLNPKVIKRVARTILHLCQSGIQIFVATHSLFLMRELDILLRMEEFADTPARFFGLHLGDDGVEVMQGDSIDDIGEIASLQEELSQSDRYLETEAE
ncbi:MAG: ATP/GTP-binding protein [Planctomycetaceae bacterium]